MIAEILIKIVNIIVAGASLFLEETSQQLANLKNKISKKRKGKN